MIVNIVDNYEFKYDFEKIEKYVTYLNEKLNNKKLFSLVFVDDDYIQQLNLEFRELDKPTDVLSFCETLEDYLGDIIISIDRLKLQAKEFGHSETRELYFLLTHGFLHLNGYDHLTKEEEKEMFSLQEGLLSEYGVERI